MNIKALNNCKIMLLYWARWKQQHWKWCWNWWPFHFHFSAEMGAIDSKNLSVCMDYSPEPNESFSKDGIPSFVGDKFSSRNTNGFSGSRFASNQELEKILEQVVMAIAAGTSTTLRFLLEQYPLVETMLDTCHSCRIAGEDMSLTPLQLASACGHHDVVHILLDVDTLNRNAKCPLYLQTALHFATSLGQLKVVEILCSDRRLNPNVVDVDKNSCLHVLVENIT